MANLYTVPVVGSGKDTVDAFRPDLPAGTSWVGDIGSDNAYLVRTDKPLDALALVKATSILPAAEDTTAQLKGFSATDVKRWGVGSTVSAMPAEIVPL